MAVVSAEDKAARAPSIPIVYGTISWWLGRKPGSEEHTHKWTVYVRSPEGIDLSYAIQKVIFRLHPTVPSPVRGASPRIGHPLRRSRHCDCAEPSMRRAIWRTCAGSASFWRVRR